MFKHVFKINNITFSKRCGGVAIEHISFKDKPLSKRQEVILKTLKFVPFYQSENKDVSVILIFNI